MRFMLFWTFVLVRDGVHAVLDVCIGVSWDTCCFGRLYWCVMGCMMFLTFVLVCDEIHAVLDVCIGV